MVVNRGRGGRGRGGSYFRGRGRGGNRGGRPNFGRPQNSVFIPFVPFDVELYPQIYPKVSNLEAMDDGKFGELILERNKFLSPSSNSQSKLETLFAQVKNTLEEINLGAETEDGSSSFEEIKKVGSCANDTMIEGVKEIEIVVQLKDPPTPDNVVALADKLKEKLGDQKPPMTITSDRDQAEIHVVGTDGFKATCFVTCTGSKIKAVPDGGVTKKILYRNFEMGKRTKWFEEHCSDPNIRVLARLVADLRIRFKGYTGLSQWAIELLSHYCITKNEDGNIVSLTVQNAFKRFLQLLSSGFFLPGSLGVRDPFSSDGRSVHQGMTKSDQDQVCATSQTLLRMMMQGGAKKVLGLEEGNICDEMQVVNGIVVQPSLGCYVEEADDTKMET